MKISVITVVLNNVNTIEQTIKSVLSQKCKELEYIIIDGDSIDGSKEIIENYANEFPKIIKFISEKDNGIYDAMNKGIKMCTGDVIGIINSDDYFEPNALEYIENYYENHSLEKLYVLYGYTRFLQDDKELFVVFKNINNIENEMVCHPSCFVDKCIYDEFGLFDLKYKAAADYDYFLKLYKSEKVNFYYIDGILSNFRIGGMTNSYRSVSETCDIRYKYKIISIFRSLTTKIVYRLKYMIKNN